MNVYYHVRLMHVSTSRVFPQVTERKGGWARGSGEGICGKTLKRDLGPVYAGAPHNSTNTF